MNQQRRILPFAILPLLALLTVPAFADNATDNRTVVCRASTGEIVDDSYCGGGKPAAMRTGDVCPGCPEGQYWTTNYQTVPLSAHWVNGGCPAGEVFGELYDQSAGGRHSLGEDGGDGQRYAYTYALCVTGAPPEAGLEFQWQNGGCAAGWSLIDVKTNSPNNNWLGYSTGNSGKGPYRLCTRATGAGYSTDTTVSKGRHDPGASSAAKRPIPAGAAVLFSSEGSTSGWYVGSSANDDEAKWFVVLRKMTQACSVPTPSGGGGGGGGGGGIVVEQPQLSAETAF